MSDSVANFNFFLKLGFHQQTTDDGVDVLAESVLECNGWLPHCTFLLRPLAKEEKISNSEVSLEEDQYKNIDGNHRKRLLKSMYHFRICFC